MSTIPTGMFVWHELMSTAPEQASGFYSELFNWSVNTMEMGGPEPYTSFKIGEAWVGGMMRLDASHGAPSHWVNYISVPDVDGACDRITTLGGKILVPAFDIPNIGRSAVAQAPDGSVFAPFTGSDEPPPSDGPPPTWTFCWQQVQTKTLDATVAFYADLFGWTTEAMGGPGPRTLVFKVGDKMVGTAMELPAEVQAPAHWLDYVAVEDLQTSYDKAVALGAASIHGPTPIPGMGTFAVLSAPDGSVFALWKNA